MKVAPKTKVRRMAWLDHEALSWALAVLRDNRFEVERRGQMTDDWRRKYDAAQDHVVELIRLSLVRK